MYVDAHTHTCDINKVVIEIQSKFPINFHALEMFPKIPILTSATFISLSFTDPCYKEKF